MIGFDLGASEGIIILIVVLVLFGGSQVPKLARNLGRAQREFKDGIEEAQRESKSPVTDTTATSTENNNSPT